MKKKTKKKIKLLARNFTVELLEVLEELGDSLPGLFESKGEYQHRVWRSMEQRYSKLKVQKGIYQLKKQGLVKENAKKRFVMDLTITGRHKVLISRIFESNEKSKGNRSTIVIFDIPEDKSKHRMFLRRLLLKNDFINLQKSVMISPFELPKEFFELMEELGIRQNVTVIKGEVSYI